jgi:effector-binding domain-containing protein
MADVTRSLWILAGWIEDNGYRPVGYHREVYLAYGPDVVGQGVTVTELQVSVARHADLAAGGRGARVRVG